MTDRPALSKGELMIARLLWEHSPATVREIHTRVPADQSMDFATVQTYLRRLETKGYASSILDKKTRVYSAKTKAKTIIRKTVDDLIARLFGGQTMPLMRHLIEDRGITSDDLNELRRLLKKLEDESKS